MEVKRERMDEIEALSVKYDAPIVVLFDCDTAGRQLRNAFLRRFPDATHAFMGARVSSAKEDGKWHARGNVGVEHGEGEDIARAIARARRADRDRAVFTREALAERGPRRRRRRRRRLGRLRRRRAAQTIGGRVPRRGRLRRATVTSPVEPVLHRRRIPRGGRRASETRRARPAEDDRRSRRSRPPARGRSRRFRAVRFRSHGVRPARSRAQRIRVEFFVFQTFRPRAARRRRRRRARRPRPRVLATRLVPRQLPAPSDDLPHAKPRVRLRREHHPRRDRRHVRLARARRDAPPRPPLAPPRAPPRSPAAVAPGSCTPAPARGARARASSRTTYSAFAAIVFSYRAIAPGATASYAARVADRATRDARRAASSARFASVIAARRGARE